MMWVLVFVVSMSVSFIFGSFYGKMKTLEEVDEYFRNYDKDFLNKILSESKKER